MTDRPRAWIAVGVSISLAFAVVAFFSTVAVFAGLRQESAARRGADRAQAAAQVQALRVEIGAELDRRTVARDRKEAAQATRTRLAICTVLASDLSPTASVRNLAHQLGCDVPAPSPPPASPAATPPAAPATLAERPRTGPSATRTPAPRPRAPATSRPAASSAPASARPSPTCRLRLPLTGTCLTP